MRIQTNILILVLIFCLKDSSLCYKNLYVPKKCTQLSFLPMPRKIQCTLTPMITKLIYDPCLIKYNINSEQKIKQLDQIKHILQLIRHQQFKTFKCRQVYVEVQGLTEDLPTEQQINYFVYVIIKDIKLQSAFNTNEESYKLKINAQSADIEASHYVGFVRALQTFLQSINCDKYCNNCYMLALPIYIQDQPKFEYRGLLIDTSRHFLPIYLIKETIDALMYNKLNILHWHIVDQDSFPLVLKSHPQLAQHASFSIYQTYQTQEIKDIIEYAMIRGVRVVPEIDTPGHTASWGQAPQNRGVSCTFRGRSNQFRGSLDVTLDKTQKLIKQVFKQLFDLFPDPLVHLGGDQVVLICRQNMTDFLKQYNITENQIQAQYRKNQKKLLRELNETKKFIYWVFNKENQPSTEPDDITHWWAPKIEVPNTRYGKIIISPSIPQFYLDMGVGNSGGTPYNTFGTWWDMFKINLDKTVSSLGNNSQVIGQVVALWSQLNNQYTHHIKIWARSCVMAEHSWTSEEFDARTGFFRRLIAFQKLLNRRGIPTSPVTNQVCQQGPEHCQTFY